MIDYGVNDGGNLVSHRNERKKLFLEFIKNSNSPLNSVSANKNSQIIDTIAEKRFSHILDNNELSDTLENLRNVVERDPTKRFVAPSPHDNDGVYSSFTSGESPTRVKFVMLDTRFHRDSHWPRSIGEVKWLPLSALIAAAIRVACTSLDIGKCRGHHGDMLGEKQWSWLEKELGPSSDADFHVIVSSVQVFTSNPVVESWGHFPDSKRRLVDIINTLQPRGLVFLSGDVHHGEISHPFHAKIENMLNSTEKINESANVCEDEYDTPEWAEVTSSGLTHTCAESFLTQWLCPSMLNIFTNHRVNSPGINNISEALVNQDGYFIGKNIGSLEIYPSQASHDGSSSMIISIHDLDMLISTLNSDNERDDIVQHALSSSVVLKHRVLSSTKELNMSSEVPFRAVDYPNFPCLWDWRPSVSFRDMFFLVFNPKGWIVLGIMYCIYFQIKCFMLLRGQILLYAHTVKNRLSSAVNKTTLSTASCSNGS